MMRKRKHSGGLFVLAILILVVVFIYSGLRILESTVFYKAEPVSNTGSKTIVRGDQAYYPRQDVEIFLLMGIDQSGPVRDSGYYNNDGAADALVLLMFDQKNETIDVLSINRDSMVEMPVLGIGGRQAGTKFGQIALSHTYGGGLEDSCENTVQTVSDLLYGITIDHYVSMNMDGIARINDAVGGVTVTVTDDFSGVDDSLPMGEIVLQGEQATSFIRSRQGMGDQLNLSRMERHEAYLEGFAEALREKLDGSSQFSLELYESAAEYIVTDCSATVLSSAIDHYSGYTLNRIAQLEGENRVGDPYMEYYLDEAAMDALILEWFYTEK